MVCEATEQTTSYTALIKDDSNGTKLAVAVYSFITVDLKLT